HEEILRKALRVSEENFDIRYGGFSGAPKFPPSMQLQLLMRIFYRSAAESALSMTEKTLKAMAYGGIYDHIGGGLHRYSTDPKWRVPHFEKMLYDNALISLTY